MGAIETKLRFPLLSPSSAAVAPPLSPDSDCSDLRMYRRTRELCTTSVLERGYELLRVSNGDVFGYWGPVPGPSNWAQATFSIQWEI
jgi:hypothetical protein